MKFRMSFFVTRPPRPVPGTWVTSTSCSEAIRATTGETKLFPSPLTSGAAGAAGSGAASGSGSAAGTSGAVGAGVSALETAVVSAAASVVVCSAAAPSVDGASAAASPGAPITASRVPTSTVSPSWTRICCTTPDPGLGTSVSTLSVEISSNGSSA
jgi:hypothetical protein